MTSPKRRNPDIAEFGQMAAFSLALAVTMFVFAVREHGESTRALSFGLGALFVLVTGFFGLTTLRLARPRPE